MTSVMTLEKKNTGNLSGSKHEMKNEATDLKGENMLSAKRIWATIYKEIL